MKILLIKAVFTLTILVISSCISIGQIIIEPNDSLPQKLIGIWYRVNSSTEDSLIFKRQSKAPYNWGDRIEIDRDGNFTDAYSAPCGNDSRLHNDTGSWTLENRSVFITTIPVCLAFKKHKIVRLNADTLILQKVE